METNSVTLAGALPERPSFSETEFGEPTCNFCIARNGNKIWCFGRGAVAERARQFARTGTYVIVHGRLAWLTCDNENPYIHIETLGFIDPKKQ